MEDTFKLEGIFKYEIFNEENELIDEYEDKNRIVDNSFAILTGLLVDGNGDFKIDTLKLGNGGVINNTIQTVTKKDTSLYNEVYSKDTTDIIIGNIGDKYVKFQWTLDYSDGNGDGINVLNEAGLYSNVVTNIMFSRKTFPSIIKDINKKILITWILRYTYS